MAEKKSAEKKAMPRVSVLERRIQNPFGEPSFDIQFKDDNITGRWFNSDLHGGQQVYRATKSLGWQYVTADMVANLDSIGTYDLSPDGKITRGERGREVLMWMPRDECQKIQFAKTRVNLERMNDKLGEQGRMLEAMAAQMGDEAATKSEAVIRHQTITHDVERIPLSERDA